MLVHRNPASPAKLAHENLARTPRPAQQTSRGSERLRTIEWGSCLNTRVPAAAGEKPLAEDGGLLFGHVACPRRAYGALSKWKSYPAGQEDVRECDTAEAGGFNPFRSYASDGSWSDVGSWSEASTPQTMRAQLVNLPMPAFGLPEPEMKPTRPWRRGYWTSDRVDRLFIFSLAMMMGALTTFPAVATQYFLKALKISPFMASQTTTITQVPLFLKPVLGYFIDTHRSRFGLAWPALIAVVGTIIGWLFTALSASVYEYIVANVCVTLCNVLLLLSVETQLAMIVQKRSQETPTSVQSVQGNANSVKATYDLLNSIGAFAGTALGGTLNMIIAPRYTLLLCGSICLFGLPFILLKLTFQDESTVCSKARKSVQSFVVSTKDSFHTDPSSTTEPGGEDSRSHPSPRWYLFWLEIWELFRKPRYYKPLIFLALYNGAPSMTTSSSFYYYTNKLHMTKLDFNINSNISHAIGFAAMLLYIWKFTRFSARSVVLVTIPLNQSLSAAMILMYTGMTQQWGIPAAPFMILDRGLSELIDTITSSPVMVVAALLCPPGKEGTVFGVFTTVYAVANIIGTQISTLMVDAFGITSTNFDNLGWYRFATMMCNLSVAGFYFLLPSEEELRLIHEEHKALQEDDKKGNRHTLVRQQLQRTWSHFSLIDSEAVAIAARQAQSKKIQSFGYIEDGLSPRHKEGPKPVIVPLPPPAVAMSPIWVQPEASPVPKAG